MKSSEPLSNARLRLVVGLLFAGLVAGSAIGCSDDPGDDNQAQTDNDDSDAGPTDDTSDGSGPDGGPDGSNDGERPDENSGGDWDWDDDEFEIRSVIPARGSVDGGTDFEIDGAALTDDTDVWFGDQPVEADLSDGRLVGTTPSSSTTGPVTVRLVSAQGDESQLTNGFTYIDPVAVDDVFPSILPTDGHVEIDIEGTGFAEPTGVSFSSTPARTIDVVDDGLLRVVTPQMAAGDADLEITVPDGTFVLEDAVHFFEPLDVQTVTPGAGSVDGGDEVAIEGDGLSPDAQVWFGDRPAEIVDYEADDETLIVSTPGADQPGAVDLIVETEFDIQTIADGFVYDDGGADQLYSIQPDTAVAGDQSEHVVSGRGLDADDAEVLIDDQPATMLESGPYHAVVELPAIDEPGPVDVTLRVGSTDVDTLAGGLEILPALTIDDVDPESGDADGGDDVTITGQGLDDVESVRFGGVSADFQLDGDELIATTPASEPGTVDVVVDDGTTEARADEAYTFRASPEIWSMQPARGAIAGNTLVTLQGRGFVDPLGVDIGDQTVDDIDRHDVYNVSFRTPPADDVGDVAVTLETADETAESPYPFVYYNPLASFGGAHGPSIDGAVDVSVIDHNGNPVPDAFVMLSTDPDTPHRGYTDARGQITLSGPGVIGPQTVTATAAEMSTVTVREVDARHLTLVINPLEPEMGDPGEIPPPPIAEFEGEVHLTGKTPSPDGADDYNMSIVETTRPAPGTPTMSPGEGSVVEGGEGHYEIRSGVGDLALVALCGYYDDETEQFSPKTMGVHRGLAVSDGDHLEIDLDCDIALDSTVPVQITDAVYDPEGPTINRVSPYLDFGYEGVFPMSGETTGLGDILDVGPLPELTGPLENVTVTAIAGSYTGSDMPYSRTVVDDIADLDQLQTTPPLVGVPDLLEPADGGTIGDEIWLGQKGANAPDFQYLTLSNSMGMPVYTLLAPGDEMVVPMPEFPSFSELPADERPEPYPAESHFALAYAPSIDGFDYHAFTWSDLDPSGWTTFAVDSWTLALAEE